MARKKKRSGKSGRKTPAKAPEPVKTPEPPEPSAAARTETEPPPSSQTPTAARQWIAAAVIVLATVAVYWNIQGNEFVRFDDRKYIYENTLVTGDGGLGAIWADLWNPEPKLHYNPMTHTTFWIEHALVGLEPPDVDAEQVVSQAAHPLYHRTQILLHACNALLVLLTLQALGVSFPAAALTALFFAVHPVTVESVAWTAERKNLLSGFFLWLALLAYVVHRRRSERSETDRRRAVPPFYLAAVVAFGLALLSKTAAVVLAPILILTDRVLDGRWSWSSVKRSVPFFVVGGVVASVMAAREDALGAAKLGVLVPIEFRPFVAVSAAVHYVATMLLPVRQSLIYPRWDLSLLEPRYWISMAVVVLAIYLIRRYRARLDDRWLWGLGLFLITIVPVLGLKRFSWMQFSFVADHYLYYGSVGVLLMVMLGVEQLWRLGPRGGGASPKNVALVVVCLAALVACGWRTVALNRVWRNDVTLWQHVLPINPDAFQGHVTLRMHYERQGDLEQAYFHRKEFARIMNFASSWRNAARDARELELHAEALDHYEKAIEVASQTNDREHVVHTEYARYVASLGYPEKAIEEYEAILRKDPPTAATLRREMANLREQLGR